MKTEKKLSFCNKADIIIQLMIYIIYKVNIMKRIIAFLIISIALMLVGCKSHSKLTSETTNHTSTEKVSDSLKTVKNEVYKDSINTHDSTIVIFMDSIKYVEKWHTQYKYKLQLKRDTIYKTRIVEKTDTLYIDKVKKVVEYKTPSEALLAIVVLIIFCIIMVFVKFKK